VYLFWRIWLTALSIIFYLFFPLNGTKEEAYPAKTWRRDEKLGQQKSQRGGVGFGVNACKNTFKSQLIHLFSNQHKIYHKYLSFLLLLP
jgi:hypothetical protein